MSYADNKGADQPVHPRSLISAFIVRCLDSIIPLVSISKISSLNLSSVAAQAGLVANPEDRFSRDEAHSEPFSKLLSALSQSHLEVRVFLQAPVCGGISPLFVGNLMVKRNCLIS